MASAFPVLMGLVPGSRVLVAGGTGTIGSAVVQAMLRQGAKVVVASRAEGRFRRLVRETPRIFHDNLISVRGDLTKEEGVKYVFDNAVKPNRDRIKHVVACLRADMTPYARVKLFDQTTPEVYSVAREEIRCHYLLMKTFIPYLEKYQTGTTYTVITGFPYSEVEKTGAYIPMAALANSALQGMVKAARAEYRLNKVAINEANLRVDISKELDEDLRSRNVSKVGTDLIGKAITAIVASEVRSRIVIASREDAMRLAGLPYVVDKAQELCPVTRARPSSPCMEKTHEKCKDPDCEGQGLGSGPGPGPGQCGQGAAGGAGAIPPQQPVGKGRVNLVPQPVSAAAGVKAAGKRGVTLYETGAPKTDTDPLVAELSQDADPFAPTHGYVAPVPPVQREIPRAPRPEKDITAQGFGFLKKIMGTDSAPSPPPPRPHTPVGSKNPADKINLIPQQAEDSPLLGPRTPPATRFQLPAWKSINTEPLYKPSPPQKPVDSSLHPAFQQKNEVAEKVEVKAKDLKKESLKPERKDFSNTKKESFLDAALSQYGIYTVSHSGKTAEVKAAPPSEKATGQPSAAAKPKRMAPPTTADVLKTKALDPVSAMAADILKSGPIKPKVGVEKGKEAPASQAAGELAGKGMVEKLEAASDKGKKDSLGEKMKDTVPNQIHNFVHPAFIKEKADKTTKTPLPNTGKDGDAAHAKQADKGLKKEEIITTTAAAAATPTQPKATVSTTHPGPGPK